MMNIRPYEPSDEEAVVDLWKRCGLLKPWNDPYKDIARKRSIQPELFLIGCISARIMGTVMVGFEGHRGWINYLAVDPDSQRQGYGRILMSEAERRLRALGCPKINLQVRNDNWDVINFYQQLGFCQDPVLSFGKRLVHDDR